MRQPARVNYFFKDGYKEFWSLIKNIFSRCGENIADSWSKVCDHALGMVENIADISADAASAFPALGHLFMMVFHFCKVLLNIVFAVPICFILAVVQTVFLLVIMSIVYIFFLFTLLADWLFRCIKKIGTSCPRCQEKYSLPTYVCECGAQHTKLIPSRYGVYKRICNCGRKLKTTFFNGRQKLRGKWICPTCSYELGGPLQVDIPIPVIGGPNSGKTCYITMAIGQIEKLAPNYGLNFQYKENAALGDDYKNNRTQMSKGWSPVKTSDTRLRYYQFYLTPYKEKVRNLISICDVAGETFGKKSEMNQQIGFKNATAFLMIVDPLSVTAYRDEVSKKIDISKYGASDKSMDEVLDTLIHTLENMNCINSKSTIKTNVAVIFTKCDIPGLSEKIGAEAIAEYRNNHADKESIYEIQNKLCERFLMEYEEENFLITLRSKFKNVQFFTCSALGHVENGEKFNPQGVEEPALWLIDKASASINLKKKWGKKI